MARRISALDREVRQCIQKGKEHLDSLSIDDLKAEIAKVTAEYFAIPSHTAEAEEPLVSIHALLLELAIRMHDEDCIEDLYKYCLLSEKRCSRLLIHQMQKSRVAKNLRNDLPNTNTAVLVERLKPVKLLRKPRHANVLKLKKGIEDE